MNLRDRLKEMTDQNGKSSDRSGESPDGNGEGLDRSGEGLDRSGKRLDRNGIRQAAENDPRFKSNIAPGRPHDGGSRLAWGAGNEMAMPAPGAVSRGRIPGNEVRNGEGAFWLCTTDVPNRDRHGFRRLGEALDVDADRLASVTGDVRLRKFRAESAIYLDTETTSLSQGAGVYVFMIGIGFFNNGVFRVEQYFMRDYDEEAAMLKSLNKRIRNFDGMVTFFGKNFDQYRIQDRLAFLGFPDELPVDCHLDLYHLSRRLYRERFENLKLKTLETRLLGFHRQNDIPGAECPEAYFRFLEGADRGRMAEVFEHNLWDILSLATLCAEMDDLVKRPRGALDKYALACALMKDGAAHKESETRSFVRPENRGERSSCPGGRSKRAGAHDDKILSLLKEALDEMTKSSVSGDASAGDSCFGDTCSGDACSGDACSGDACSGDSFAGNTSSANTSYGNFASGNTSSGNFSLKTCYGRSVSLGPLVFDARFKRIILLKRAGRFTELAEELHALLETAPRNPDVLVEMAKYHEHRIRDYPAALHYARQAEDCLLRWDNGTAQARRKKEAVRLRIQRLDGKCRSPGS